MIQAALLLGRSGLPEYFQDAERRIRSHLLPSQNTDGGWGFPGPNDRDGGIGPDSILDITAGAVQALWSRHARLRSTSEARIRSVRLVLEDIGGSLAAAGPPCAYLSR